MPKRTIEFRGVPVSVEVDGTVWSTDRILNFVKHGKPSTAKRKGVRLVPHEDQDGYLRVRISDGHGKRYVVGVHRLVALAFIPNPKILPSVNHIDENKKNNSADNLEWCTVSYNNHYNDRYSKVKHVLKPVQQLDDSGEIIAEFPSIADAVVAVTGNKVGASNIGTCCSRHPERTAYGYHWRFKQ